MQTAAVFLQKTYNMIESSPVDVAEWSNQGRSFLVKDIKQFETVMLPKYFKHGNFASFSRQLRFYSFEKAKKYDNRIGDTCLCWWEFSNPHFQRDAPHEMVHIKRKTYADPAAFAKPRDDANDAKDDDVGQLKRSMSTMQSQLDDLASQISKLTSVVQICCGHYLDNEETKVSSKKIKMDVSPSPLDDLAASNTLATDEEIDSTILDSLLEFRSTTIQL
ncbi:hypothetical protein AC1031_021583 [Aphanomyces cochlioides]|nr:hypothetical protein AC1031_021583 [Aphanomyces cochlioides]